MAITDAEPLVYEILEAKCRELMARRASLPATWEHRAERRDLLTECDVLLERFNYLTLGR